MKKTLYFFDEEYHDDYDLEIGTSRKYIFKIENDILFADIDYKWDYWIGSKWLGRNLVELIENEILKTLSLETGLSEDEFIEKYYYSIVFSTEENKHKDEFLLADRENEDEIEIELPVWTHLKDSIIKLSYEHGANTQESDCQFHYDLSYVRMSLNKEIVVESII